MKHRRQVAELRAQQRELAAQLRDAHQYVDWLTEEKNRAERKAEQADARRRRAEKCALAVADLAHQWRVSYERIKDAYAHIENGEIGARDALDRERGRKPARPYVIRDNPKDAA